MVKRLLKRLARPMARPFLDRMDARVRERLRSVNNDVEPLKRDVADLKASLASAVTSRQTDQRLIESHRDALAELEAQAATVNDYLPILLNAISAGNAASREMRRTEIGIRQSLTEMNARLDKVLAGWDDSALTARLADDAAHLHKRVDEFASTLAERIGQVERRSEFIRREVLFEARYGGHEKSLTNIAESMIVSEEKVAAAGPHLRLNLGCGHIPIEGFVNVDGRALDGVDVVAEVGDLPFESQTISAIHSAHLLEHFPVEELRRRLLPYWFKLLRPGGDFTAIVPDAETMMSEYANGRFDFHDLRLVTFGDQEYEGDFHFNMFSQWSLQELLEEAGFIDVHFVASGRRNGACYEMEVTAKRPVLDG